MADLLKEFFKRDLTDAEESQLADQLAASHRHSERFAQLAKKAYFQTGLPRPENPGASSWGGVTLKVAGGLVVTGALIFVVLKNHPSAPALAPKTAPVPTVKRASVPAAPARPPQASAPVSHPVSAPRGMVHPLAYDPGKQYGGLDLVVDQASTGFVTVRILDGSRAETRLLYLGVLEKGKWDFQWDGLLADGSMGKAGIYTVEVQSGSDILTRSVQIQDSPLSAKK